jgi:hypothetical protein
MHLRSGKVYTFLYKVPPVMVYLADCILILRVCFLSFDKVPPLPRLVLQANQHVHSLLSGLLVY